MFKLKLKAVYVYFNLEIAATFRYSLLNKLKLINNK